MGYFRCIINGTSPSPGEVWSVGTSWIGPNTVMPFTDLLAWAEGVGDAISALVGNTMIGLLSTAGAITEIRTEQRADETGLLMQAAEATLDTAKAGSGTPNKNLQTSLCVSLITPQPGRSYRGRCYWPAWTYTPSTDLHFTGSQMAGYASGFKALADLITAQSIIVDPSYNMVLAVRSRLLQELNPVVTLALGDVPDTQRRRRDAVTETYTTLAM